MSTSLDVVPTADVKSLFANVVGKLYDSIELQLSGATVSFKQFTDSADILIDQVLEEVPPDETPEKLTTGVQFPEPHTIFIHGHDTRGGQQTP